MQRDVGAVALLLGLLAVTGSVAFGGTPSARLLRGNFPVNESATEPGDISAHNSPTVVRNPIDDDNIVIANRIDSPDFSCALHVSADAGVTFEQKPIPAPAQERDPKCFAPDVTFGPDGTLYVSFVTLKGIANVPHAVWLTTSDDGGQTLSPPTPVLDELAFQVRVAADPNVEGRLYMTWLQASEVAILAFPETGYPINAIRSDDGGLTWTEPVRVSDTGRARVVAPAPAVQADGDVFVSYLDLQDDALDYAGGHGGTGGPPFSGSWSLVVARSGDGGESWTETVVDDELVPTERFIVFLPPFPSLAVGPSNDDVHVAFHSGTLGDADVWVWNSTDDGRSFQAPVRVNDTPRNDGTSQYLPKAAVAPSGRIDIVYYDRRVDERDVMNEVSMQSSFDQGRSFQERITLSDQAFDSRIGPGSARGLSDLGSRLGLVSGQRRSLAVWTDTRAGTEASAKQDLVRAVVAFDDEPLLSGSLGYGARYGGIALIVMGLVGLAAWRVDLLVPDRSVSLPEASEQP